MVSKCANPDCCTPFLHFREGALFLCEANYDSEPLMDIDDISVIRKQPHRLENFWLCDNCASRFVVKMIRGKVEVVPRGDAVPCHEHARWGVDSLRGAEDL